MNISEYLEREFRTLNLDIVMLNKKFWQPSMLVVHGAPVHEHSFMQCPIDSYCGRECKRVIDAALAFIKLTPDALTVPLCDQILTIALDQVAVLVDG